MKIRPRNIPKFQEGSKFNLSNWIQQNPEYYKWYSSIYPNAQVLQGSPLKQRNDLWNKNQLSSSHYTTDDLQRSAYNNYLYTNDYDARSEDLTRWGESQKDFGTISDRDFVNRYNNQARSIREAREAPQTYNTKGYTDTNRTFRNMFWNRSRQGTNIPLYTIGYQDNIEDIEGTSTWQRRMDRYEKPFNQDTPEGQKNRTFFITRPDGSKIKVYKKQNGDIGLFNDPNDPESPKDPESPNNPQNPQNPNEPQDPNKQTQVPTGHQNTYGFDWGKINEGLTRVLGNPNLYAAGRLAGNLINNERVYDEALKGIKPFLRQTYNTHRQVVGDEATKQAYYRRAAQGQTAAARPFTSDADRQMAYQMEAKRIGDELRAQGDLADNQEIRRTSDESNQHQWANTQRATEVANANRESLVRTNAEKHKLLAQKHAAQWSSIDNYLREIEYRKRQQLAENQAMEDQIYMLDQEDFQYTPEYNAAYKKYNDVLEKHKKADGSGYDLSDPEVIKARGDFQNTLRQHQKKQLLDLYNYRRKRNNFINFAKSGTKMSFKKKDDLLYKSARDVVEHFRRMTKLSQDDLNRKPSKIEKLTPHPKSTRKYEYGGTAPFTVYTPVALGGESSMSTQRDYSGLQGSRGSSGNGSGKSKGSDTLDMIKNLFKEVVGKGLPSDVNSLYRSMQGLLSRAQAFGTELSTDDIASMYLSQMEQLNQIQNLKANFDKSKEIMMKNDAANEIAVNALGQLAAQDKNGNIVYANSIADIEKNNLTPLTNSQISDMRTFSPAFARRTDLDAVLANGVGMSKIGDEIRRLIPTIGTDKLTQEGYTKVQAGQIQKGFEQLLGQAPDGDYSYTESTESQKKQRKAALGYITAMLPKNMKAVLKANADLQGIKAEDMLEAVVRAGDSTTQSITFNAVTGKAAKKEGNGGNGGDGIDSDKIKTNPLLAMQREMGGVPQRYEIVTKDSNTRMAVNGTFYSAIPKVKDDTSIDSMLSQSGIDGILDSKYGITFGDQQINPENLKDIMYSNTGGMVVTLPCKIVNGHKQVNLAVRESYEKAEKEALAQVGDRQSPQFQKVLGDKLKEHHLDSLLDSTGRPNRKMFAQFLVVEAYTTDKIKFDTKSQYVEKVQNPDDSLEQRMSKALSTNDKKNDYSIDSKNHWFEMFYDDIYRGTVFIPLNNNPNSAMNSWGNSDLKIDQSQDLEELYQLYNKSANYKNNNSFE